MIRTVTLAVACFLTGCGGEEPPPPEPPPPPPTFADFAGRWQLINVLEGVVDSIPATITGTTGARWYMTLEGRDSIPLHPALRGDSLIIISDKYGSILRENTVVQVRIAAVLTDFGMAGNLVATYDSDEGQELVTGTMKGFRP